jgi:hypothetical protein
VAATTTPRTLILACGALAGDLKAVLRANGLEAAVTLECLPGEYHMRPEKIVPALRQRLAGRFGGGDAPAVDDGPYDRILIGYGDCGTGGQLDRFCAEHDLERLPGDHCYQFFAGQRRFLDLHDAEPGTFYLTDYLARHFDLFVTKALGLDRHPELAEIYFGNYRRLVYLRQRTDAGVEDIARRAADTLGLAFEMIDTGYGQLEESVISVTLGRPDAIDPTRPVDRTEPV